MAKTRTKKTQFGEDEFLPGFIKESPQATNARVLRGEGE